MKKRTLIAILIFFLALPFSLSAQQEDVYSVRRKRVMEKMDGGIAILTSETSSERLNKHFYYLTGLKDPETTLILIPDGDVKEILFTKSGDWSFAENQASAEAYKSNQLGRKLFGLIRGKDKAYVSFGDLGMLSDISRALSMISTLKNINSIIVNQRVIKDNYEIEILKRACDITAESLNDVFKAVKPGLQERDLALILEYGYARRRSPGKSFLQAASGPNSTHIHFNYTDRILEKGDIIVFDVGAYWDEYTSDISRTIPVSGKFTKDQREIYQVVLNSQKAAIEYMVPGSKLLDVQKIAEDVLINGLVKLGLVLDDECEWQRKFFIQHGFYHFIGLDVHDVWYDYRRDIADKVYEPGMIMTMEPGLYFPEGRLESRPRGIRELVSEEEFKAFADQIRPLYDKYLHMGVRIEDDVLITKDGNEILTSRVPKEIKDIEKLMKKKSPHNQFNF